MGVKERLKEYCRASGIKISDFERHIGASNGYVNSISRGIGPDKRAAILENYPNLNIDWVETGHGGMLVGYDKKNMIPLYEDVRSIGGYNDAVANVDDAHGVREMIDAGDWFPGATAAIHHYGDSMVEYPSGCILVLKRVRDARLLINGENYVIETDEFRITKQVQYDGGDFVTAYSSNRETYPDGRLIHAPIKIPVEAIRHFDLVVGCVIKKFGNPARIVK